MVFVTHAYKHSFECGIHHTTEEIQVKMMCDDPHLCQFIPIQAYIIMIKNEKERQK